MTNEMLKLLSGEVLDESMNMSLAELCRICGVTADQVLELIEYGVIEPQGRLPGDWRFSGVSIRRIHSAGRLQHDLGVNLAGTALVLDLLEELEQLRMRLRRFED